MMVDNDEPDHGCYSEVKKVTHREMIVLAKIFHNLLAFSLQDGLD